MLDKVEDIKTLVPQNVKRIEMNHNLELVLIVYYLLFKLCFLKMISKELLMLLHLSNFKLF